MNNPQDLLPRASREAIFPPKRCICGKSKDFPLCDNSHESERWTCGVTSNPLTPLCFAASPKNQNFALRLASVMDGRSLHDGLQAISESIDTELLILLSDGTDLVDLHTRTRRVRAHRRVVIGVGCGAAPGFLAVAFPDDEVYALKECDSSKEDALLLWGQLLSLCRRIRHPSIEDALLQVRVVPKALPKIFLSHAVADERLLLPVIHFLRAQYRAEIFLCGDSIEQGERWHSKIIEGLKASDVLVLAISAAMLRSVFCAFEVGFAAALALPTILISLDGSAPPAYIQHAHMHDVPRYLKQHPWLNSREALTELLLGAL